MYDRCGYQCAGTAVFRIAHPRGVGFGLTPKIALGELIRSVKINPGGEFGSGLFSFQQLSNVVTRKS